MKRILALTLLLALLIVCLPACANTQKEPSGGQETENTETKPTEPSDSSAPSIEDFEPDPDPVPTEPPVKREELITNAVAEELNTDGGYFSFYVPQINLNTPDAQKVNREIMDDFGATADEAIRQQKEEADSACYEINWDICWYENTFALIVWKFFAPDSRYYMVYNFDYATGSQLSFEDIIGAAGFTEASFRASLREAAEAKFYELWPEDKKAEAPDAYAQMLDWTVSDEVIQSCRQVFRADAGDLMVIQSIGSLAGSTSCIEIFPIAMG